MVNAVVDSLIRIPASGIPPKALALIRRELTFTNPEYVKRVKFDRWVGATPEEICLLAEGSDGTLLLPRGAVGVVTDALARVGEFVHFDDQRVSFDPVPMSVSIELRDYQREAVIVLVRRTQGGAVLPCGSGKTIIGVGIIAETGQPALILVHTKDLMDQWVSLVRRVLELEPGIICEGTFQPDRVTVAMVQSLAPLSGEELARLGRRFGLVVADEAHHLPCATYQQLLPHFPAKYRFGLTATPERPDGLTPLMLHGLGPILVAMDHQALVECGHLVLPEVRAVETGCTPVAEDYSKMVGELVADPGRNALIVDLAIQEAQAGHAVLVLSNRVDHCRVLARALTERGTAAEALTGSVGKTKRRQVLERFRSGGLRVVCATSLADEGLDIERLSRLILATPARAEGRTIQRLGRLMRPHPDKGTPVLFDLVDDHPTARHQHAARRRAYRKVLGTDCVHRLQRPAGAITGAA